MKRTTPTLRSLAALLPLVLAALSSLPARAEESNPPSAAEPEAAASSSVLETVVVTAQRREQVLGRVPMSVAAMGAQAIERSGTKDITDLARVTPGLNVLSVDFTGAASVAIRGIRSSVGAPTTGIYIDDAPVQISSGCFSCADDAIPRLFDVERIEVLRGPQGTLYGSSSQGGAVRFITAAPRLSGDLSGLAQSEISVTGGALNADAGVMLDTPLLNDLAGLRLSVWRSHEGGYIDAYRPDDLSLLRRGVNRNDAQVARLALRFAPTERLTISPSIFLQDVKQADRATYWESLGVDKTRGNLAQPMHDRFTLSALSLDYDFDAFALKSVTSFFDRRQSRINDYSNLGMVREWLNAQGGHTARTEDINTQRNLTQEFRFTSADSAQARLSWIAGVYLQRRERGFSETIDEDVASLSGLYADLLGDPSLLEGGTRSYASAMSVRETELAVFGELSYKLSSKLSVSAGLRATESRYSYQDTQSGWWASSGGPWSGSTTEHPLTPKLGLSYQADADSLFYATAAKGFRIGGNNESLAGNASCAADLATVGVKDVPLSYHSDTVWSYELGSKLRLLQGRASVAGSLFVIDWSDIQGGISLPTCGFGYVANFAKARSQGFELEAQLRPVAALQLGASVGYADARYTRSVSAGGSSGDLLAVRAGDRLPTPPWSVALNAEYRWSAGPGQAYLRGDYQYVGGYPRWGSAGTVSYDPQTQQVAATRLFNARLGWQSGHWELAGFVKNALNMRTTLMRSHSSIDSPLFIGMALPPRTIGLSLKYRL